VTEIADITAKPGFPKVTNAITRPAGMVVFNLTSSASKQIDCRKDVQFRIMVLTPVGIPFTDRDDKWVPPPLSRPPPPNSNSLPPPHAPLLIPPQHAMASRVLSSCL
jgi:hypothetical protein